MSRRPAEERTFKSWDELRAYVEELTNDIYRQDATDLLTTTQLEVDPDWLDARIADCKADVAAQTEAILTRLGAPNAKAQ
jgi:hypothetical protein